MKSFEWVILIYVILVLVFMVIRKIKSRINNKFKVGQIWRYHSRPSEQNSTITILKIDNDKKLGMVAYISVDNLAIIKPNGEEIRKIEFIISLLDLKKSVTELLGCNDDTTDMISIYEDLKKEVQGKNTINSTTVMHLIESIEKHHQQN